MVAQSCVLCCIQWLRNRVCDGLVAPAAAQVTEMSLDAAQSCRLKVVSEHCCGHLTFNSWACRSHNTAHTASPKQLTCGILITPLDTVHFHVWSGRCLVDIKKNIHRAIQYSICLVRKCDPSHKNPYYCQQLINYNRLSINVKNIFLSHQMNLSNRVITDTVKEGNYSSSHTQILSFYEESWPYHCSLPNGREMWKRTGRHQNNTLNAGHCSWQQSLWNTLGNLLWQVFMCQVPFITMTLFTPTYPTLLQFFSITHWNLCN